MKRLIFALLSAVVLPVGNDVHAQQAVGATGTVTAANAKVVTLYGCVVKGKGGYILPDLIASAPPPVVASWDGVVGTSGRTVPMTEPQVLYWLSDVRKLKKHVGRRVLIMGEIKDSLDKSEVAVERDDRGMIELDVKYRARKITAALPDAPDSVIAALSTAGPALSANGAVGTSGAVGTTGTNGADGTNGTVGARAASAMIGDSEIDIDYVVRRVDVKSVHVVEQTCR